MSHKCSMFCKFCRIILNVTIVLAPCKINDSFKMKDSNTSSQKSFLFYQFVCAGCNACSIVDAFRQFTTTTKGHLETESFRVKFKRSNAFNLQKAIAK